jgi:chromosome segregation ATPase
VYLQDLTGALATSESQKETLLAEAERARKAQADALHYSELAQIQVRNAKHELVSTKARLENMQHRYTKQEAEILNLRSDAEAYAARMAAEVKVLKNERENLRNKMQGV